MDEIKVGKWYWVHGDGKFENSWDRMQVVQDNGQNAVVSDAFGFITVAQKSRFISPADSRPTYPSEVGLTLMLFLATFLIGRSSVKWASAW